MIILKLNSPFYFSCLEKVWLIDGERALWCSMSHNSKHHVEAFEHHSIFKNKN
jgi:hypothetical protein